MKWTEILGLFYLTTVLIIFWSFVVFRAIRLFKVCRSIIPPIDKPSADRLPHNNNQSYNDNKNQYHPEQDWILFFKIPDSFKSKKNATNNNNGSETAKGYLQFFTHARIISAIKRRINPNRGEP